MDEFSQEWFELQDHRRRLFSRAVWIPIYGSVLPLEHGKYPDIGHVEEVLAVGSALIYIDKRDKVEGLDWHYWTVDNTVPSLEKNGQYNLAESFYGNTNDRIGLRLVLTRHLNSAHPRQVVINQDFVMAYGLLEEGNYWLRPDEGYEQVVRLTRDKDGAITFVEVRAEYLKDYLAARNCALRLYYYRQRQAILPSNPKFDWPEHFSLVSEEHDSLEVRCHEIGASGDFAGTTWAMFEARRTDVDPEEEVPDFSGNDDEATETRTTRGVRGSEGGRFRVTGEMWRGEWIEPANQSSRLGYDEPDEVLMVQLDGSGGRVDLRTLKYEEVGKYLWFNPVVISDLLARRGAGMRWYTADTGGVSPSPDWLLHFGMNRLGLINAYAYDVARRPLWERRIWAAHNCRPDGGVSAELMEAQMACKPASTISPEIMMEHALEWIGQVFQEKFGVSLFREHDEVAALTSKIHRFRATDESSLRSLAKDLIKISVERINKKSLIDALGESKSELGTLKLLQKLLAKYTDEDFAYTQMTPLFGVYDLRGADAHLSSSNFEDCYTRVGVDRSVSLILQAAQMIHNVAYAFGTTGTELQKNVSNER